MKITLGQLRRVIREELQIAPASQLSDILSAIVLGTHRYIRMGMSGSSVSLLQEFLLGRGYDLGDFGPGGDGVDGAFGPVTDDAVEAYQADKMIMVDGIVGPETSGKMLEDLGIDVPTVVIAPPLPRTTSEPAEQDVLSAGSEGCPPARQGRSNVYGAPGSGSFTYQLQEFDQSLNNWRSSQPTEEQLRWLIQNHGIETVIRLNGNEGKMTMEEEKAICDELGVVYNEGSPGFMDSHSGYVPGAGYVGSIQRILPILSRGNCLIHCRAGADRTGYLVAAYLKDNGVCTDLETLWDYTTSFNGWGGRQGRICEPSGNWGFIKYLEGFYPMDLWCRAESWRSNCTGCRGRR